MFCRDEFKKCGKGNPPMSMEEIQSVSLEILKKIADICEDQGLRYSLAWGTLIGAVRHHDFIPWDDDVDIQMPRSDYLKLKAYFKTHAKELYPLRLFDGDVKDYPYLLARVSNDEYVIETCNEKSYGLGIFIDIYILDGTRDTFEDAWKYASKTCKYPRLIFLSTRKYYHFGTTKGFFKRFLKFFVFIYAKILGKKYFERKLMGMIDKNSYDKKQYVGCVSWCERPKYAVIKKTEFEDMIDFQFGKYYFKGPREYDKYLRMWYGDYMQLPPEKDRIYQHLYNAYKK